MIHMNQHSMAARLHGGSYESYAISDLAQSSTEQRGVGQRYHQTALHAYFAGIDDLVQTKGTIVTALLRAFHPCIAHPRAISSTPGSRSDVYKCANSREWTQTSD